MIDWSQHFDHIFCMHFSGYVDRLQRIISELKRVGIYDSGVFSFHNTISSVFIDRLMSVCNLHPSYNMYWKKPGYFNCQFNHYCILRESLLAGYKKILVIEDDVVFLKDIERFNDIILHSPQDAELIFYDYWFFGMPWKHNGDLFQRIQNREGYHSSSMYAMHKRYMQRYINYLEKQMRPFDEMWNFIDKRQTICYRANIHPGIQKPYNGAFTSSNDIEQEYNKINVNLKDYQYYE